MIKTTLLTKKQEEELFKKVDDGDKKAISELLNANLFLVESIAKRYEDNSRDFPYKTLVKIGKDGLKKAIGKYNPSSQYKFSTYATWWIRQEIHNALGIKDK
jgi:RNA polymerase primary sigma factor